MNLDTLRIPPGAGPSPTAAQHNGLLDVLLAGRLLGTTDDVSSRVSMRHPWKVKVERFEQREGATLDPALTWRVEVAPGTLNDALAFIPYRRTSDPRGWKLPKGYAAPDLASPDSPWIDRDACDDLDDPPFLVARELRDFTAIADRDRLKVEGGAFCSAADWERELYRAHVLLSATALTINTAPDLPPPAIKRLRLYVAAKLPAAAIVESGAVLELATLYLLRDPRHPADSELRVRQREFWGMWTELVRPAADLAALIADLGTGTVQTGLGDIFLPTTTTVNDLTADLVATRIDELLAGTARLEVWSV